MLISGDIESMPFVEALRQLQLKLHRDEFCLIHISMVPIVGADGEQKTKPTQHSVKELRALGLVPDFIVCRAKNELERGSREKISLFCNVPPERVLSMPDLSNIYHVPLILIQQSFHKLLVEKLNLNYIEGIEYESIENNNYYKEWNDLAVGIDSTTDTATIAVVGKVRSIIYLVYNDINMLLYQ